MFYQKKKKHLNKNNNKIEKIITETKNKDHKELQELQDLQKLKKLQKLKLLQFNQLKINLEENKND